MEMTFSAQRLGACTNDARRFCDLDADQAAINEYCRCPDGLGCTCDAEMQNFEWVCSMNMGADVYTRPQCINEHAIDQEGENTGQMSEEEEAQPADGNERDGDNRFPGNGGSGGSGGEGGDGGAGGEGANGGEGGNGGDGGMGNGAFEAPGGDGGDGGEGGMGNSDGEAPGGEGGDGGEGGMGNSDGEAPGGEGGDGGSGGEGGRPDPQAPGMD
jgi:hypothetical protein